MTTAADLDHAKRIIRLPIGSAQRRKKRSDTAAKAKTLLFREGKPCSHQLFRVSCIVFIQNMMRHCPGLGRQSRHFKWTPNGQWCAADQCSGGFSISVFFSSATAFSCRAWCFYPTKGKWKARQFGAGRVCESVKAKPSASSSKCIAVEFGQVRPRAWADQLGAWSGYLFRTMSRPLAISSLMVCLLIIQPTDPNPLRRQGQRRLLYRIYFGTSFFSHSFSHWHCRGRFHKRFPIEQDDYYVSVDTSR
ncbi:hypothetical protein T02_8768 [Trichinella nativa]|uniref:Uncharacterized protein n=1 Tax=Trichinella nativa TaxID=6335 RepID=A0A0V1KXM7_9BILA|nr:hypothetical protein T02_8768 [Trichinella nativa]